MAILSPSIDIILLLFLQPKISTLTNQFKSIHIWSGDVGQRLCSIFLFKFLRVVQGEGNEFLV